MSIFFDPGYVRHICREDGAVVVLLKTSYHTYYGIEMPPVTERFEPSSWFEEGRLAINNFRGHFADVWEEFLEYYDVLGDDLLIDHTPEASVVANRAIVLFEMIKGIGGYTQLGQA